MQRGCFHSLHHDRIKRTRRTRDELLARDAIGLTRSPSSRVPIVSSSLFGGNAPESSAFYLAVKGFRV